MRRILLGVCLVGLLAGPVPAASEGETNPEPVESVVATADGNVTWIPPAMHPADLAIASYLVYGRTPDGPVFLQRVAPMQFTTSVTGGFEAYGVAVEIEARVSVVVYSCVHVDRDAVPPLSQTCLAGEDAAD